MSLGEPSAALGRVQLREQRPEQVREVVVRVERLRAREDPEGLSASWDVKKTLLNSLKKMELLGL